MFATYLMDVSPPAISPGSWVHLMPVLAYKSAFEMRVCWVSLHSAHRVQLSSPPAGSWWSEQALLITLK